MNIYREMVEAGIEIDHHETDLYVPVTKTTRSIVAHYPHRSNVSTFVSQIDGRNWFDIPFAYVPAWPRARNPQSEFDHDAAMELRIWVENSSDLYQLKEQIVTNLLKKTQRDIYDPSKAPRAWSHFLELGAKSYAREFATPSDWSMIFTKATRDAVAADLTVEFQEQAAAGEWDYLLK